MFSGVWFWLLPLQSDDMVPPRHWDDVNDITSTIHASSGTDYCTNKDPPCPLALKPPETKIHLDIKSYPRN